MLDWSALLVGLGVGGVVGALASAVVAAGRVTASFAGFSSLLKAYLSQRSDPESQLVASAFAEVSAPFDILGQEDDVVQERLQVIGGREQERARTPERFVGQSSPCPDDR